MKYPRFIEVFEKAEKDSQSDLINDIVESDIAWDEHVNFNGNPDLSTMCAEVKDFLIDSALRKLVVNVEASWAEIHSGACPDVAKAEYSNALCKIEVNDNSVSVWCDDAEPAFGETNDFY